MSQPSRTLLRAGIVAVSVAILAGLFALLRPSTDEPSVRSPTPQPSPASTGSASPTEPSTSSPSPEAREIEIEVEDSRVEGPAKVILSLGDRVVLEVRADVADEVHVHGYDLLGELRPGRPARIAFTADVAGVFEVELEEAGQLLTRLEVRP